VVVLLVMAQMLLEQLAVQVDWAAAVVVATEAVVLVAQAAQEYFTFFTREQL
jgi:hypothetical protein